MELRLLAGLRIVGLNESIAASYCTKLLAELGAEVIKIERPKFGDETRWEPPFAKDLIHPECSLLFNYLNTGKLGITLDIDTPQGHLILTELVRHADILVSSYPPRRAEGLNIRYSTLRSVNPRLTMVSITPFGQTGPYQNYKSCALTIGHAAGDGYLNPANSNELSRPPTKVGAYYYETVSGLSAAVGLLFGLFGADAQHIDISQQEAIMALIRYELTAYPNEGTVPTRSTRGYRVGGTLPCKDGYIHLAVQQDYQWTSFVNFLEKEPTWPKEERYRDWHYCLEHYQEVNQLIVEALKKYTKEDLYHAGQGANCPITPFYTPAENMNSPQTRERGAFVEMEHPYAGKISCPSLPFKASQELRPDYRPAPLLGEHNEEVFCNRLNYTKEDLLRFAEAGIV